VLESIREPLIWLSTPTLERPWKRAVPRARASVRPRRSTISPGKGKSAKRGESWRDWALIALLTHGQLLAVALIDPAWYWLIPAALPFGFVLATGTLTIVHDAGHRRFARREWPNQFATQTGVPLGFWVSHWGLKHRVHHKASQVYLVDEATTSSGLVRLHPAAPWRPVHRYQHLYTWFLYAITGLGEIRSQIRFLRTGYIAGIDAPPVGQRVRTFFAEKAGWLLMMIPYALLMGVGKLTLFMLLAMMVASELAAIVLVVGHINQGLNPPTEVPSAKEWSRHLVKTTANFSTGSFPMRWITGGMTHHLAHHLKPVAPRYELPTLHRTLVRELAEKAGEPLIDYPSLTQATIGHYRRLKELGAAPQTPPSAAPEFARSKA
jgi:linoleoyl-CoA desaturase